MFHCLHRFSSCEASFGLIQVEEEIHIPHRSKEEKTGVMGRVGADCGLGGLGWVGWCLCV